MPEELTEQQLAELRADLATLDAELRAYLVGSQDEAKIVELDQEAVGRISRIDAIQQQSMAKANRSRVELRLRQIAVAVVTFDEDEYGWCKKCGEAIGYRRLKARPESPCCVTCMAEIGG